ncbi:uncharacterized protein HD556DRAFT_1439812 [Suillus plorans]|uniref:Uncharacterized protein n=1 Tax=Suillus plorans TaxID=116603 RepID=A0A9P7DNX4_9AGAM|nr:uncharacterized protein HD556DRAFT_1439812 [Suillus plorans]KAG1799430.1 hypothetical protein HD556DRAFT_1439812 [Suillus plorans]
MSYTSTDSDSHPSGLADAEALLIIARFEELCEGDTTTSSTPHSHDFEPCLGGQAHGQGAPVYSCGCYRRTKVEPALALADALADVSEHQGLEKDVDSSNTQVGGRSGDSEIWPLKRKRSKTASESDPTLLMAILNVAPALEVPKCRKLGKAFKLNRSMTHETSVLNVAKRLEAAIDRQTEVLSKIYRVLEGSAK